MIEEQIAKELKEMQRQMLADGRLKQPAQIKQYCDTFRTRFGPEQLQRVDGEALLELMHGRGSNDSLAYWLEFKDDEEFPLIFGSIGGGSALKFEIFKSAQTGSWMKRGTGNNPIAIPIDEAIDIVRRQRQQLIAGVDLLDKLPSNASDEQYFALQEDMDARAPDVSRLSWGHKYFSMLFPEKLDTYHAENYQTLNLVRLLQMPPTTTGRYVCAGRYVAIAAELDMPLNHLVLILNVRNGRPYSYWRLSVTSGQGEWKDLWERMRETKSIGLGWAELGDLSEITHDQESKDQLRAAMLDKYKAQGRWTQEVFGFVTGAKINDLVLAFEGKRVVGIGRIIGPYFYEQPPSNAPHRRPVDWLSFENWSLKVDESVNSNFRVLKKYANLIEIERQILITPPAKQEGQKPITASQPGVPIRLQGLSGKIHTILDRKGQVILYGPPGTGKTYWAMKTASDLASIALFGVPFSQLASDQQAKIIGNSGSCVRICTFHPAYGYEDFIEGYRPEVNSSKQMSFERRDGIFKKLCDDARSSVGTPYYLIIDEINRGDIPRIFGELLTLLEKDKRGQSAMLPLSRDTFSVPPNVYIIATMNTADRSIALLDAALRRRFGFIELMPDISTLGNTAIDGIPLGPWLEDLNKRILQNVGRDARNLQIGHSYLLERGIPITDFAIFARILREDIIPLLEEYCYENYQALEKILGPKLVDGEGQYIRNEMFEQPKQDELKQALLAQSAEILTSPQAMASDQMTTEEEQSESDEDQSS